MIPANMRGEYIALPDNGFGAQNNRADFVIRFYEVRPVFKTGGDGTTVPGTVDVLGFTPLSDPHGLLDAPYISKSACNTRTSSRTTESRRPCTRRTLADCLVI
jgi:hypothetical protein